EVARLEREIATLERGFEAGAMAGVINEHTLSRLGQAERERAAAQARAASADRRARDAIAAARVAGGIQDRNRAIMEPPKPTPATRAPRMSDEDRAILERTRATEQYISSLTDEVAKIGLSDEALRRYEVTQALARATTD